MKPAIIRNSASVAVFGSTTPCGSGARDAITIGAAFGYMLAGSIIVESIFALHGSCCGSRPR